MEVSSSDEPQVSSRRLISPRLAFLLVSFTLGQLGDGLNIFQGIYLVGIGWNPSSVGLALSLMGFTSLIVQTWAGDIVDKTKVDRRFFLVAASIVTAISASTILFVPKGNTDHMLIFGSKILEGIASSFIGPCLAALTLATFGPVHFDAVMASNILWGHVGTLVAAVLAGAVAYIFYPHIKLCFLVIGASALVAILFVKYLPQGDPLMGRGFQGRAMMNEHGELENLTEHEPEAETEEVAEEEAAPQASAYAEVLQDRKTLVLAVTGFFFHFANANVLLVLGELMSTSNDGNLNRSAIPLTAAAIVLSQLTMTVATWAGDKLTLDGMGRKPLFLAGLASLPIRCALIILWRNSGNSFLLATQVLDGLGGGMFGLIHPYLVADITFNTGRFNFIMGLTASCFGLGATMSNYFGQLVVQEFGHVDSLTASMFISVIPIILFTSLMPETRGKRGKNTPETAALENGNETDPTDYHIMA